MTWFGRKPAPPPLDIAAMIRASLDEARAMEAAQRAAETPPSPTHLSAPCPHCQSPFSVIVTDVGVITMVLGLNDIPLGPMRTCCGCATRYFVTTDGAHRFGDKLEARQPQVREPRPANTNSGPRYPTPDADMVAGFANREP